MANNLYLNVSRILKRNKMQQKDLAEKMGCAPAFVSSVLIGNPTLDTLQRIANALSVPVSTLLREQDEVVGYVEVNGKKQLIYGWDDVYELVKSHEKAAKKRIF